MKKKYKYAVYPRYITSKNDGDKHFISFDQLVRLYAVDPSECLNMDLPHNAYVSTLGLKALYPRYHGDYDLP